MTRVIARSMRAEAAAIRADAEARAVRLETLAEQIERDAERDDERWIPIRACDRLPYHAIRALIASGALPASRVGRELLVRIVDVEQAIATGLVAPKKPSKGSRDPKDEEHHGDELDRALAGGRLRSIRGGR